MKKELFWKNFNMNKELDIAGTFIYDGLKIFDSIENFREQSKIFEFLYFISVGVERLEKIVIILTEHNKEINQEEFEESLITHSHQNLLERINLEHNLRFSNSRNAFIQLLTSFYKTYRYDSYNLDNAFSYDKEREKLVSFIEKYLNINIKYKDTLFCTNNNDRIKRFIGKIIGKICSELYDVIETEAMSQNIYTYEITHNSKAFKIFRRKEYTFINETIIWKEILIYLLNNKDESPFLDFLNNVEPLDFDVGLIQEYLNCFESDLAKQNIMDEIEDLYNEVDDVGNRIKILSVINDSRTIWGSEEEE